MIGALIIGDELLSGKRADKHLAKVIAALSGRGLALDWALYLGDDRDLIAATLARTFASEDIVFSFGGIGATPDDHTRQAAAAALGRPIVRHPEAVREIEGRFGDAAYPNRIRMAEFPRDATLIPNPVNRIAGFSVDRHHFLPGFPEMAWPMMEWVLDTLYPHLHRAEHPVEVAIVVRGAGEGDLVDIMDAVVRDFPEVKLASLPQFSRTERIVEVAVRGARARVAEAMEYVRAEVAKRGYAFEDAR